MASRLPPLTEKQGEVRELTKEDFAKAVPFAQLPESLRNSLLNKITPIKNLL